MNAQTPPKKRKPRDTHTALVYIHGMGEQRRYEEISRLVDALELYDANTRAGSMEGLGIRFELEQPRTALPQEVGYFRVPGKKNKKNGDARHIRFYEAYYANLAAGGVNSIRVLPWLGFLLLLCNWWNLPFPGILLTFALGVNIFFLLAGLALSLRERPRHTLVEPKLTETRLKMA